MRALARIVQRRQFGARSSFLRRSVRQQRGFASVNSQDVKGLTVIDHHYEYIRSPDLVYTVVKLTKPQCHRRWSRRRRPSRSCRPHRSRSQDRMRIETLPNALTHRRRTRRDQCRARKHDGGRLAVAHVRYSQRVRLAWRPRRNTLHDTGSCACGCRARELWHAVFENKRWYDIPTSAWWAVIGVWQGWSGVSNGVCGGSYRTCDVAYVVWAKLERGSAVFH